MKQLERREAATGEACERIALGLWGDMDSLEIIATMRDVATGALAATGEAEQDNFLGALGFTGEERGDG